VEEAIGWIHDAAGVAVWAHPFWDVKDSGEVCAAIERYRAAGLDGVEAFYTAHTQEQTLLLAQRCEELGLLATGSSDYHGPGHRLFSRFRAFDLHGCEPNLGPIAHGTLAAPARTGSALCFWLTGLSGSGKSTVGRLAAGQLRDRGHHVEVLDGDDVRQNLCAGLGFSREDRDVNVRRIAWVADLLSRNGVVTFVAAVSPYRATRDEARARMGKRFVEVHVRASVDECERRDVKGLYERARADARDRVRVARGIGAPARGVRGVAPVGLGYRPRARASPERLNCSIEGTPAARRPLLLTFPRYTCKRSKSQAGRGSGAPTGAPSPSAAPPSMLSLEPSPGGGPCPLAAAIASARA
jgi:adenylyl-sulfate kinase